MSLSTRIKNTIASAISLLSSLFDLAFGLFFALVILLSVYVLKDTEAVYNSANADQFASLKPRITEETGEKKYSFEEVLTINSDVQAWLQIYGTAIDYPLLHGDDNSKYLTTDLWGKFSSAGSLFIDVANAGDFSDFNTLIHGHHMYAHAMFGDISEFENSTFFDSHQYGELITKTGKKGLHFFAYLKVDSDDNSVYTGPVTGTEQRQNFLDNIKKIAFHYRDLGVTTDDHIVLMNSCRDASYKARQVLVGLITDDLHPNPFPEPEEGPGLFTSAGRNALFDQINPGLRPYLAIILSSLFLLILVLIWFIFKMADKKKDRSRQKS